MKPIVMIVSLAVWGCASQATVQPPGAPPTAEQVELSQGYALFYELVSKQSGLGKALIIGSVSADSKALIHEIAEASDLAAKQIDAFAKADPSLNIKDLGLPAVEVDARAAIESSMSGRLLFAGKDFEVRLLLSQTEATKYGTALAQELIERESDRARKKWLNGFFERYGKLRERAEVRLSVSKP